MKKALAIFGVLVLLLAVALPTAAFASPPSPPNGDPNGGETEVEVGDILSGNDVHSNNKWTKLEWKDIDIDPQLGLQLGLSSAKAGDQKQGFEEVESEVEQEAKQINKPVQFGLAGGAQSSKIFGESKALNVAKSGWQVSLGNLQFVELEPEQDAKSIAWGDNKVYNSTGGTEVKNWGDAEANGGFAASVAFGAKAESGEIENETGDNKVFSIYEPFGVAKGGGNAFAATKESGNAKAVPIALSAAFAKNEVEAEVENEGADPYEAYGLESNGGPDGLLPVIDAELAAALGAAGAGSAAVALGIPIGGGNAVAVGGDDAWAQNNFGPGGAATGTNSATNNGSTGAANAQNFAGPTNANGGSAGISIGATNDSIAAVEGVGNFAGDTINAIGDICISSNGSASGSTGGVTTGAVSSSSTVNPTVNQGQEPGDFIQVQKASPEIDQYAPNKQEIEQEQEASAASLLAQILANVDEID